WNTLGGPPLVIRSSYQRTPTELPAVTAWLTTRDSWSPKLRYANRNITRSDSESSCWVVPFCGMQVPDAPQAAVYEATVSVVGPVNVELAGVAKSTWNFQNASVVAVVPSATTVFASPAGGAVPPSTSLASSPPNWFEVVKHTWVAVVPASIAARSI